MLRAHNRLSAAVFALALSVSAGAQTIGYNLRTGDLWVDARMGEIDDYGQRYRPSFEDEVVSRYGAPRSLVNDLLGSRHWSPSDVYYACALAHAAHRPCIEVADRYERDRGRGWGALAMSYGIKPGSPQFHAFKNGFARSYGHWGHPLAVDRDERVQWEDRPKHGHGHVYGHGKDHGDDRGRQDDDSDADSHEHGHGHDKDHGNPHGKH